MKVNHPADPFWIIADPRGSADHRLGNTALAYLFTQNLQLASWRVVSLTAAKFKLLTPFMHALARAASKTPRSLSFGQYELPRKYVILPLSSNDRLYSFHYSGFQPSYHNILSSSVSLTLPLLHLFNPLLSPLKHNIKLRLYQSVGTVSNCYPFKYMRNTIASDYTCTYIHTRLKQRRSHKPSVNVRVETVYNHYFF
jgi:hypothetical protein